MIGSIYRIRKYLFSLAEKTVQKATLYGTGGHAEWASISVIPYGMRNPLIGQGRARNPKVLETVSNRLPDRGGGHRYRTHLAADTVQGATSHAGRHRGFRSSGRRGGGPRRSKPNTPKKVDFWAANQSGGASPSLPVKTDFSSVANLSNRTVDLTFKPVPGAGSSETMSGPVHGTEVMKHATPSARRSLSREMTRTGRLLAPDISVKGNAASAMAPKSSTYRYRSIASASV